MPRGRFFRASAIPSIGTPAIRTGFAVGNHAGFSNHSPFSAAAVTAADAMLLARAIFRDAGRIEH
jgi:hypothetical protein